MKSNFRTIILYLVLIAVILTVVTMVLGGTKKEEMVYSDIYDLFSEERVRSFTVDEDAQLTLVVRSETEPDNKNRDQLVRFRLLDY